MLERIRNICLPPSCRKLFADHRQLTALLLVLLAGAAVRFLPAVFYYNPFDLESHNIPWAIYGAMDRFGIYTNPGMLCPSVDYPPIFPFLLTLLGKPLEWAVSVGCQPAQMFLVKLLPILADLALILLIWMAAADYGCRSPWKAALVWAFNPSILFNCAIWGQADSLLLFFVFAFFWALDRKQPEVASILFALGCLTKLQMCYFAPILLLGLLLLRLHPLRFFGSLALGGFVGFLGWFPFMRRGDWLALPLRIYFGGVEKYSYVQMNAANLFALGDHYLQPDSEIWFWKITFSTFSTIMIVAAFCWLILNAVRFFLRRSTLPLYLVALIYCEILFLFTTRQHERYQLPIVVLCLFWWIVERRRTPLLFLAAFSLITLSNQAYVLLVENHPSAAFLKALEYPTAIANLLLFIPLCLVIRKRFCALHPVQSSPGKNDT